MNPSVRRRIRLVTGLVLFGYVIMHLLNLSLGLLSLEAMDAARPYILAPWQNPLGLLALYGSVMSHVVLGLESLYRRRTLRMTGFDALQFLMALALPPLIIIHVLGTRAATVMFDIEPSYAWLMVLYWKWAPATGLRQTFVIVVAWIHGCMGVYYWMRLQSWWPTWRGYIYPFAFVVPVMALLGFVEGGKDALDLSGNREWMALVQAGVVGLDDPAVAKLYRIQSIFLATYTAVLILVLAARAVRLSRTRPAVREGTVEVAYVDGPTVIAPTGLSLLDVSRINEIAHTNICGGRGRCGTCRIRTLDGAENLSGEMALERETLVRIGAEAGTRLACQCVPNGSPIRIERLVPLDVDVDSALDSEKGRSLHPLEVSGASGAS